MPIEPIRLPWLTTKRPPDRLKLALDEANDGC